MPAPGSLFRNRMRLAVFVDKRKRLAVRLLDALRNQLLDRANAQLLTLDLLAKLHLFALIAQRQERASIASPLRASMIACSPGTPKTAGALPGGGCAGPGVA